MDPDRWRQVDELLQSALLLPGDQQEEFVRRSCAGHPAIEQEVRSLISSHRKSGGFLEAPAIDVMARVVALDGDGNHTDPILGQIISHYRAIRKLGSGGMGVVYEAEDLRLGRLVALKFLSENLTHDPKALQRFEREARAVSFLNHPNICTLFEVEEHNGQPVIVMELLEGDNLKERLRKGPIACDELLDLGIQATEGLEVAHAKGIVHRDVKPGNIFILNSGRVKLLDFGLAKVAPGNGSADARDDSLTGEYVIAGTTAYLSPEQIKGEEVDARSDLFSLGVVLYEMAAGRRPFEGKDRVRLMTAILESKLVPASRENPSLPIGFDTTLAKCLEKDRTRRYQRAVDLCSDLKALREELKSGRASAAAVRSLVHQTPKRFQITITTAAILLLAALAYFGWQRKAKTTQTALTEKDTIVLADFDNSTGDAVFDGTLRQGLSVQLDQSPFLSLISDERIRQTLALMDKAADQRLTPEIGREVCQRTGSAVVLDGSIASLGSQYIVGLRAVSCRTGDVLAEEQASASSKEKILAALDQAAVKLRGKLGESLSTVEKFDTPLEQATTPSLEALQAYTLGRKMMVGRGQFSDALPFFQRAIQIDPNFAMAFAALGAAYGSLGETELGAKYIQQAYARRTPLTQPEKFYIESAYYHLVIGDLERARQVYEISEQTYPRYSGTHLRLWELYCEIGDYDKSLTEIREAARLDPSRAIDYANLVLNYINLNRLQEARATANQMLAKQPDSPFLRFNIYLLDFLEDDPAGMQEQVQWAAAGKPGTEGTMLAFEAETAAYAGHMKQSRDLSRRAVDSAMRAQEKESAALFDANQSLWESLVGNKADARRRADSALRHSSGRDAQYEAALGLALGGDESRARALADDLTKRFPDDTRVQFDLLPTIRAQIALSRNDPGKALDLLQPAARYELGSFWWSRFGPIYVRGEASLATHRWAEAAAEFRKILEHRGIVINHPFGALAHLQLARAYAAAGDKAKAKPCYEDFLNLWKDADSDIPLLKEAKAEYAKLQ